MGLWLSPLRSFASGADTTPPSPEPTGTLNVTTAGDVVVTLTNTGETGCTRHLERRVQDTGDYASVASTTTVASGTTLTDSSPSAATYDYRLVDIDAAGNRTQHGTDFGPVVIGTSTWNTVIGVIRSTLVAQGIDTAMIFDGRVTIRNWGNEAYVLKPLAEVVTQNANALVLREYPVEVQFWQRTRTNVGAEHYAEVRTAQDLIRSLFDFKSKSDFPSLTGLGLVRVDIVDKDVTGSEGLGERASRVYGAATAVVRFPVWEAI